MTVFHPESRVLAWLVRPALKYVPMFQSNRISDTYTTYALKHFVGQQSSVWPLLNKKISCNDAAGVFQPLLWISSWPAWETWKTVMVCIISNSFPTFLTYLVLLSISRPLCPTNCLRVMNLRAILWDSNLVYIGELATIWFNAFCVVLLGIAIG